MKNLIFLLLGLGLIMLSCKKDNEVVTTNKPGYFVLTELRNNLKSAEIPQSLKTGQSGYDLGEVKASREFSFILTNGGNQPIFDIKMITDNRSFTISPNEIPVLEGNTNFENTSTTGFFTNYKPGNNSWNPTEWCRLY